MHGEKAGILLARIASCVRGTALEAVTWVLIQDLVHTQRRWQLHRELDCDCKQSARLSLRMGSDRPLHHAMRS